MLKTALEKCISDKNLRLTAQRQVVARVLSNAKGHPDVNEIHRRALELDAGISIATVYRTLRLFEETGILEKHEFGSARPRYEETTEEHHDHLIDVNTGDIIEFQNQEIEALQEQIAHENGMRLIGHKMELYVRSLNASVVSDK